MKTLILPLFIGLVGNSGPEISATGIATIRSEPSHVHLIYEFSGSGATEADARSAAQKLVSQFTDAVNARSPEYFVTVTSPRTFAGGFSTTSPGEARWRTARKVGPIPISQAHAFIEYMSQAVPDVEPPERFEIEHRDYPKMEAEAIRLASRNAKNRAEASAEALGFELGNVILVEVREVAIPMQMPPATFSVNILGTENAQTVSCTATVVVRYALKDK